MNGTGKAHVCFRCGRPSDGSTETYIEYTPLGSDRKAHYTIWMCKDCRPLVVSMVAEGQKWAAERGSMGDEVYVHLRAMVPTSL